LSHKRDVSSVGSVRQPADDWQEVTGSIPVRPTILAAKKNMYYIYVLYSNEYNKSYVGFTSDLGKRIASHNHPLNKGFTSNFKPWRLIYSESYHSKKAAMIREKQLKTAQGRNFIKQYIQI